MTDGTHLVRNIPRDPRVSLNRVWESLLHRVSSLVSILLISHRTGSGDTPPRPSNFIALLHLLFPCRKFPSNWECHSETLYAIMEVKWPIFISLCIFPILWNVVVSRWFTVRLCSTDTPCPRRRLENRGGCRATRPPRLWWYTRSCRTPYRPTRRRRPPPVGTLSPE